MASCVYYFTAYTHVIGMNRKEAVALLKELYTKCPYLAGKAVALMPPNSHFIPAIGYQIHISTTVDEYILSHVKKVVEGHKIQLKEEYRLLIIYKQTKTNLT
jgi:hypothetical protein